MIKNYNTVLDRQHAQRVRNALKEIGGSSVIKTYNTVLDRQHAQRVRNALRQIGIEVYLSEYFEDTYLDVYCSPEDVETINEIIDNTDRRATTW